MTRTIRTSSVDSNDRFGSRSNSIDDTYIKSKPKPINVVKRRKRDQYCIDKSCIEISISPPDQISYYKEILLIFNNK